jgi:hypothetical protein
VIEANLSKVEQCRWLMKGVNQKNFWLIFSIRPDMQTTKLIIKTVKSDESVLRINLSKALMAHAIRRNVT